MPPLLQIALGGAIGAMLRYLVSAQIARRTGIEYPWGTLSVNVLGSFVMGLAAAVLLRRMDSELQHLAPFVMTGMLGGFTTFSAFSLEVFLLVERGRPGLALFYAGSSVVLGLAAFALGLWSLRAWSTG
ncbi:MAG TPA: fluoride efflux transporter CrcB [Amaricoccus sp.]|uniref:fluoride efflux transporter CrcB n=1 Tax=Amaricoccus sp. TaxID=1872485 RepID=UPI002C0354DD|nr:fluoride efflux transporter CrcB [Amaricoccus sp.]HMQ93326.1 fluoride efflux transporter CrcB [Amaricoccus sp.]HMR54102.1 fluoride efflux transporter CrcB [Amaricoccus sp.]HMR60426.1 fluoride efflux transporter CrcB [Amaricoccus sp.]HMU01119.1 fluoride efflux transporter CrcB [Amaricoccus sp.]